MHIISSHGNATYTVDMNSVTCTCPDWMKNEMPCKHFFAVVQHTNFSWEELPYAYRNHPLFMTHNNCQELLNGNNVVAPELTNMSRRIAKEIGQASDMATGDNWTINLPNDMEIVEEVYNNKNEEYSIFQYARCINELCKNLLDSTYYCKNKEASEKCLTDLTKLHDNFVTSMQSSDVEIPLSNDLKYKTIQKLSKPPTFQDCKVTEIAVKRKARKRNYGDIMGLLDVNRTIRAVHKNTPQ